MAIGTGTVSFSDIRSEWNRTGAISLSEMYRGGTYVKSKAADNTGVNLAADVPTSGVISVNDFRGEARGFRFTFSAGATNQNASTIFGDDYDLDYPKEIVINSSVELGAESTSEEALEVPSGGAGTITITNNGTLTGAGGAAGAAGGDAFEAASTCVFVNNGTVRAGGGGGGTGGNGGNGQTSSSSFRGGTQWVNGAGSCNGACSSVGGNSCGGGCEVQGSQYKCTSCYLVTTSSTSGGSGGSGGVGAGYNQSAGTGSSGSSGGTNAGSGGSGGAGGTFGAAGSTGATGANGNVTNGSSGSSGGAAGRYLNGSSFVTFTNNGTVQGGTA